jgi:hypothetical protein
LSPIQSTQTRTQANTYQCSNKLQHV